MPGPKKLIPGQTILTVSQGLYHCPHLQVKIQIVIVAKKMYPHDAVLQTRSVKNIIRSLTLQKMEYRSLVYPRGRGFPPINAYSKNTDNEDLRICENFDRNACV